MNKACKFVLSCRNFDGSFGGQVNFLQFLTLILKFSKIVWKYIYIYIFFSKKKSLMQNLTEHMYLPQLGHWSLVDSWRVLIRMTWPIGLVRGRRKKVGSMGGLKSLPMCAIRGGFTVLLKWLADLIGLTYRPWKILF